MDIRKNILTRINKNGKVTAAEIVRASGFSRVYVNRFFRALRHEGRIVLIGKANRAVYVPATRRSVKLNRKRIRSMHKMLVNRGIEEHVVLEGIKRNSGVFLGIRANIGAVLDYAFTEMLNNAIEHSRSRNINVDFSRKNGVVWFDVRDFGVGIFNNIMRKKRLGSVLEAAQDLIKGKETTAPDKHSGEGIFFTSKMCDFMSIQSYGLKLIFDNVQNDIFLDRSKKLKGTRVLFRLKTRSNRALADVFKKYTDSAFRFDKTKVNVKLFKIGADYISRSQARRVMAGLDKFKVITLDFKGVRSIGQGFADEVFRVWRNRHPTIRIIPKNADKLVEFMINRV